MVGIDATTKQALVVGIEAAHRIMENNGKAGTDVHRRLRALEDELGSHPGRECFVVDAPAQRSEYDSALVKWLLHELSPEDRRALFGIKDGLVFEK